MTITLFILYLAIGIAAALLRLSSAAVGLIVVVLVGVGVVVAFPSGWLMVLVFALAPMILIEASYLIGMIVFASLAEKGAAKAEGARGSLVSRLWHRRKEPGIWL